MKLKLALLMTIPTLAYGVGIETQNFYEENNKDNVIRTKISYEETINNNNNIEYTVAEGQSKISEAWTFDYTIKRNFYRYGGNNFIISETTKQAEKIPTTTDWSGEYTFTRSFGNVYFGNKEFSQSLAIYIHDYEQDNSVQFPDGYKTTEYSLKYQLATSFPSIGMGGTTVYGEIYGSRYFDEVRDGYGAEIRLGSSTIVGYGIQNALTLHNHYMNVAGMRDTYMYRIEDTLKWTYELSKEFAISPEITYDSYNFENGTSDKSTLSLSMIPYLLFSKEIKMLSVYSKIGLAPGYSYQVAKTTTNRIVSEGKYYSVEAGIQYSW